MCGSCGVLVPKGDPLQIIQFEKMKRMMYRCREHANSEVPPMLPEKMERLNTAKMIQLSRELMPKDWKYKQANEREPGQEG